MDSVKLSDEWQKIADKAIENSMKQFADKKVSIFNLLSTTKDIKKFLYQLVSAIMVDLKTRQSFVSLLTETLLINDVMNIKMMELEKRIKELEDR